MRHYTQFVAQEQVSPQPAARLRSLDRERVPPDGGWLRRAAAFLGQATHAGGDVFQPVVVLLGAKLVGDEGVEDRYKTDGRPCERLSWLEMKVSKTRTFLQLLSGDLGRVGFVGINVHRLGSMLRRIVAPE